MIFAQPVRPNPLRPDLHRLFEFEKLTKGNSSSNYPDTTLNLLRTLTEGSYAQTGKNYFVY